MNGFMPLAIVAPSDDVALLTVIHRDRDFDSLALVSDFQEPGLGSASDFVAGGRAVVE